jgi:hypothetical protein
MELFYELLTSMKRLKITVEARGSLILSLYGSW